MNMGADGEILNDAPGVPFLTCGFFTDGYAAEAAHALHPGNARRTAVGWIKRGGQRLQPGLRAVHGNPHQEDQCAEQDDMVMFKSESEGKQHRQNKAE